MSKQLDPLGTTAPELQYKGNVIIVGDSWGCGEWSEGQLVHPGLEQYLIDDGYRVINRSIPSGNNIWAIDRLCEELTEADLDRHKTQVFFFCTDWQRDIVRPYNLIIQDLLPNLEELAFLRNYQDTTPHEHWHRLFRKLEKLAQNSRIRIGLIGGCADTITVDDRFEGIYEACSSMTNLCIDNYDWSPPVLSMFDRMIVVGKKTDELLETMQMALDRRELWKANPNWFWPDNLHANRFAHKKLFDFLKDRRWI